MFKNSTTVLKVFDIEINLASSWFLIAALITWSLADQVFPQQIPGLSSIQYMTLSIIAMLLFFVSLLLHELAHALVAKSFGLKVPRITLFLFGGVAELGDEPDTAAHEFWIAIAGPAMSLALASIFWATSVIVALIGSDLSQVHTVLTYLATTNLILAVFNLLPAFPLDGGRVLRAAIWLRTGRRVQVATFWWDTLRVREFPRVPTADPRRSREWVWDRELLSVFHRRCNVSFLSRSIVALAL